VTFEEAAAVPEAGLVALQALRWGKVQEGQRVLIAGASGGIGTFAVQIAKAFGAEVTGLCGSGNLDMVRSIGADRVIDYTEQDFVADGRRYDLVLATAGSRSILDYRKALGPKGTYVATGGSLAQIFQAMLLGPMLSVGGRRMGSMMMRVDRDDLVTMKGLIEAGKVRPVIDRRYGLSQVADALGYYGEGHARGKVVITMEEER
jgi:NADPH:quinone reductase-like Zn-dependent oxidoreductase